MTVFHNPACGTSRNVVAMIEAAGFGVVRWRDLSGGIAAIHSGWRL